MLISYQNVKDGNVQSCICSVCECVTPWLPCLNLSRTILLSVECSADDSNGKCPASEQSASPEGWGSFSLSILMASLVLVCVMAVQRPPSLNDWATRRFTIFNSLLLYELKFITKYLRHEGNRRNCPLHAYPFMIQLRLPFLFNSWSSSVSWLDIYIAY